MSDWEQPSTEPSTRGRWRRFSWVVVAANVAMAGWLLFAWLDRADCSRLADRDGCELGTLLGVAFLVFVWVALDVVLGVLWLVTRRQR